MTIPKQKIAVGNRGMVHGSNEEQVHGLRFTARQHAQHLRGIQPGCKICSASAAMAGHPANFRGVKDEMPSS